MMFEREKRRTFRKALVDTLASETNSDGFGKSCVSELVRHWTNQINSDNELFARQGHHLWDALDSWLVMPYKL